MLKKPVLNRRGRAIRAKVQARLSKKKQSSGSGTEHMRAHGKLLGDVGYTATHKTTKYIPSMAVRDGIPINPPGGEVIQMVRYQMPNELEESRATAHSLINKETILDTPYE